MLLAEFKIKYFKNFPRTIKIQMAQLSHINLMKKKLGYLLFYIVIILFKNNFAFRKIAVLLTRGFWSARQI